MEAMTMSRESEADWRGDRLTRDERKALRKADLADCSPERRAGIKAETERLVAYLHRNHETQTRNGMNVSDATRARNLASPLLTLECIGEIEAAE